MSMYEVRAAFSAGKLLTTMQKMGITPRDMYDILWYRRTPTTAEQSSIDAYLPEYVPWSTEEHFLLLRQQLARAMASCWGEAQSDLRDVLDTVTNIESMLKYGGARTGEQGSEQGKE